ncbi:hypothetical protein GGR53DRAFT_471743 [Hypoxylon sp. FL1150]|nr:hypothetical protein GGR53DRAFT_471743 [Hypoxylon sp. FL1150]
MHAPTFTLLCTAASAALGAPAWRLKWSNDLAELLPRQDPQDHDGTWVPIATLAIVLGSILAIVFAILLFICVRQCRKRAAAKYGATLVRTRQNKIAEQN